MSEEKTKDITTNADDRDDTASPTLDCSWADKDGETRYISKVGFTKLQDAAIRLRVPRSGTPWLDDMIREARRLDASEAALTGLAAAGINSLSSLAQSAFRIGEELELLQ